MAGSQRSPKIVECIRDNFTKSGTFALATSCHHPMSLDIPLRLFCAVMLWSVGVICHAQMHGADLKSIAILEFDLVDDQHELSPATVEYLRLTAIHDQLGDEFEKNGLYRVVNVAPAAELIKMHQARSQLRECNGCEIDIARALQADRVLVGWVQKVSNLIVNINIRIEDVATGTVLLSKSVDLRGNTDESWRRGVTYIVKSMVEKNQGNL
jgi:hypothetical protein